MFLRVLEYYAGVLILTTNRMAVFDEAFRSRIHVSIYYPPLEKEPSDMIWAMNIKKLSKMDVDFDENEIKQFADEFWKANEGSKARRWNGRQVKNAFQTALALASWDYHNKNRNQQGDRPRLTIDHFQMVRRTSEHFDEYINHVHGGDMAAGGAYVERAQKEYYRRDDAKILDLSEAQWAKDNAAPDSDQHKAPMVSETTSGAEGKLNAASKESAESELNLQQIKSMLEQILRMQKK